MPRFVVQQHFQSDADSHFDLMLEAGEALLTFQCGKPPDRTDALPALVRQLPDHRLDYLQYEGAISRGRGWCAIHDRGTFEWLAPAGPPIDFEPEIRLRLCGAQARGTYRLVREPATGTDYWRLRFERP